MADTYSGEQRSGSMGAKLDAGQREVLRSDKKHKPSLRILVWNIAKKNLTEIHRNVIAENAPNIVVFIEPPANTDSENENLLEKFHTVSSLASSVRVDVSFSLKFVRIIQESSRTSFLEITMPGFDSVILGSVHFHSKLYYTSTDQVLASSDLSNSIRMVEATVGHSRTIIVGDLNMDPFEDGMTSSHGLNAVMDERIAKRGHRIVNGIKYPFFYNPMWSLIGQTTSAPGTYFKLGSTPTARFWHMFDQVLLRPELLPWFCSDSLRIVCHTTSHSLVGKTGIPNKRLVSDHLPIAFDLNLKEKQYV